MNTKNISTAKRSAAIAAPLAIVALSLFRFCSPSPEAARAGIEISAPAQMPNQAKAADERTAAERQAEPDGNEMKGPAPIVDEVLVEKDEVCSGEENLVTVRAHTPDGTDAFLHYAIGDATGPQVPVRTYLKPDGTVERPKIRVFGRNNVMTEVDVPPYRIKDCKPPRMAMVVPRVMPNSTDEYELQVRILDTGAKGEGEKPFEPVSYRWSFGDGSEETTSVPRVVHSYEGRAHDRMASSFLIGVEVKDRSGETLVGRRSLQVMSSVFENYVTRGIVTVVAIPTPRFPVMDRDGVVHQSFQLRHFRDQPVHIERIQVLRHYMGTGESSSPANMESSSLGVTTIPPGKGVEISLDLDTRDEPDTFALTYMIEGTTADGIQARGSFTLMRPPPRPTREASTPVSDPMLMAKIVRAREILGQEFVTDEDIWRLEREGRMGDLQPLDAPEPRRPERTAARTLPKKPAPGMPYPTDTEEAN